MLTRSSQQLNAVPHQTISCKINMKQKNYIFKLLLKIWFSTYFVYMFYLICMTIIAEKDKINRPHCYINPVIPYLYCLFISSILSGISITMFLNCFAIIRNNSLYSFLSFFLAHILIMLYVYIESEYKIVSTLNLYTIPFMVILLCLYIIFRNKVQLTSTCAT